MEAAIAALIAICVCFLLIESFLLFVFLGLASSLIVKIVLQAFVRSCTISKQVPSLEWVSRTIDYLADLRSTLVNLVIVKSSSPAAALLNQRQRLGGSAGQVLRPRRAFCFDATSFDSELGTIVDHIIEDYILIWHDIISPSNHDFVDDCRILMKHIFMDILTKFTTKVDRDKFCSQVIDLLTENLCDPNPSHSVLYESETELVRNLVENLLSIVGVRELLDLKLVRCTDTQKRDSLYILIRELLTKAVFIPIVSIVSDPNWLNYQIYDVFNDFIEPSTTADLSPLDLQNEKIPQILTDDDLTFYKKPIAISKMAALQIDIERRASSTSLDRAHSTHSTSKYLEAESKARADIRRSLSADVFNSYMDVNGPEPSLSRGVSEDDISDCESGIEVGPDASEKFSDSRLFTNIRVRETEEAGSRNDRYVVYCIRYDAVTEEIVEVENKSIVNFVRRETVVKRRFREFVTLQSRLEENPSLKRYLRRIKMPSKLRVTTNTIFGGAKMDRETIAHRKAFLEKFLTDLCNREPIANSKEMQSFMAYGTDARLAYVKSKSASQVSLRLDKVIFEGFKGAVNLIKTALPVELIQEGQLTLPSKGSNVRRDLAPVGTKIGDSLELEVHMCQWRGTNVFTSPEVTRSAEASPTTSQRKWTQDSNSDETMSMHSVESDAIVGEEATEVGRAGQELELAALQARIHKELPLTNCAVDLLSALYNEGGHSSIYVLLFKSLFGQVTERLLSKQMGRSVTKSNGVHLLHLLHEAVWKKGHEEQEEREESDGAVLSSSKLDKCYSVADAERAISTYLRQQIPGYSLLLSYKFNRALNFLLTNLQIFERNRMFVYQLINMITNEIKS